MFRCVKYFECMDGKVNGFIEVLDPTVTESGEWDFGSVYLLSRRAGFSGCHAFAHGHGDGHHLLRLDDHGTRGSACGTQKSVEVGVG